MIVTDVPTRGHLGGCLVVRVTEATALLNRKGEHRYSAGEIETVILAQGIGKKGKQKFLQAGKQDSYISKSRKSFGGNTSH